MKFRIGVALRHGLAASGAQLVLHFSALSQASEVAALADTLGRVEKSGTETDPAGLNAFAAPIRREIDKWSTLVSAHRLEAN